MSVGNIMVDQGITRNDNLFCNDIELKTINHLPYPPQNINDLTVTNLNTVTINNDDYPVGTDYAYLYCTGNTPLNVPFDTYIKFFSSVLGSNMAYNPIIGELLVSKAGVYKIDIYLHNGETKDMQVRLFVNNADQGQAFGAATKYDGGNEKTYDLVQSFIIPLPAGCLVGFKNRNFGSVDMNLNTVVGVGPISGGEAYASLCIHRIA